MHKQPLQHMYLNFCATAGTSFLIEDVACPVDKLADMTMDLVNMFEKYGYKDASCFGHALEGNLHLVFSQVRRAAGRFCSSICCSSLITCRPATVS